ncbi:helix-turn-helix domain-containing protein [Blastopirellula sp. J2-11]|uniref:helix-turn-helix domain-containing protein n=1 Tax=Blastopirellula sp. J2-11 TaxID=2943192 RepID=UPI0021C901D5|nr:helix-turn-helix domain-containing protein [Blastopirellula sp. J2-11]UUO05330.1 helix-turn-helix domain-containing protein [Blastopirellula sp. J2-11]
MITKTISRPDAATAIQQSRFLLDTSARRLSEKLCDPSGVDDYRQELALHILKRWNSFDPSRGSVQSFVNELVRDRERDIIRSYWRKCRGNGQTIQWPVSSHDGSLLDVIDHRTIPGEDWREVDAAIKGLIAPEQTICQLYRSGHSISDIARRLHLSRGAIYRSLNFIGQYFEDQGLREYIDFPSAREADGVTDDSSST